MSVSCSFLSVLCVLVGQLTQLSSLLDKFRLLPLQGGGRLFSKGNFMIAMKCLSIGTDDNVHWSPECTITGHSCLLFPNVHHIADIASTLGPTIIRNLIKALKCTSRLCLHWYRSTSLKGDDNLPSRLVLSEPHLPHSAIADLLSTTSSYYVRYCFCSGVTRSEEATVDKLCLLVYHTASEMVIHVYQWERSSVMYTLD